MDTFRAQDTASPEEKKRQQRSMLVSHFISLILYIPMVVIGHQHEGECEMAAPKYLLIGGGIGLGITLLKIIAILTPSDCDDKFTYYLSPFVSIAGFAVTIWGCVVIFRAYTRWTYQADNKGKLDDELLYCPYTPYMTAFVLLILQLVLQPIIFCCEFAVAVCCYSCCCVCCLMCSACCAIGAADTVV